MNQDIAKTLRESFDDHRLSRKERKAIRHLLEQQHPEARADWRHVAFELAQEFVDKEAPAMVIEWLKEVSKALAVKPQGRLAEAHFSPGEAPRRRILEALAQLRQSVDICVFTITDNTLSDAILQTHESGKRVRIIADNDKALDRGSDIARLAEAGLNVRIDRTKHHMHHKFALFDEDLLLSGSYNWTRSAAKFNQENVLLTDDRLLVQRFSETFSRLWQGCEPWA